MATTIAINISTKCSTPRSIVEANFLTFHTHPEVNSCIPTWFAAFVIWTKKSSVSDMTCYKPNTFRCIVATIRKTGNNIRFPKNAAILVIKNCMLSGEVNVNITTAPVRTAIFCESFCLLFSWKFNLCRLPISKSRNDG